MMNRVLGWFRLARLSDLEYMEARRDSYARAVGALVERNIQVSDEFIRIAKHAALLEKDLESTKVQVTLLRMKNRELTVAEPAEQRKS